MAWFGKMPVSILIAILSRESVLCTVRTAGYKKVFYSYFVLLIYPAEWTGVILNNSCIRGLGREVPILSCYQSLNLCTESYTSEPLVGFAIVTIFFRYSFRIFCVEFFLLPLSHTYILGLLLCPPLFSILTIF